MPELRTETREKLEKTLSVKDRILTFSSDYSHRTTEDGDFINYARGVKVFFASGYSSYFDQSSAEQEIRNLGKYLTTRRKLVDKLQRVKKQNNIGLLRVPVEDFDSLTEMFGNNLLEYKRRLTEYRQIDPKSELSKLDINTLETLYTLVKELPDNSSILVPVVIEHTEELKPKLDVSLINRPVGVVPPFVYNLVDTKIEDWVKLNGFVGPESVKDFVENCFK